MRTSSTAPVRRRHSREEIVRIVADYERGERTQREIAARHGISPATLQNWLRRQRSSSGRGPREPWVEVVADVVDPVGTYRIELPLGRALALGPGWRSSEVRELVTLLSKP